MSNSELVSIIVPVYNVEKFIDKTIECVLCQEYENWELLLVENGSTDSTLARLEEILERIKDSRIRLIKMDQNVGAARARNKGLKESKGRYIAYLDADDIWKKDKLSSQLKYMEHCKAAFSFTSYEFGDEFANGTGKVAHVPSKITYKEALGNTTIFTTTVMFDTKLIDKEFLEMPIIKSEDTALWWKVLRSGYIGYGLDENLVIYRRAGKTLSSNKLEAIRRIWNLYRKAEGLNIIASVFYFGKWAINAVKRRV